MIKPSFDANGIANNIFVFYKKLDVLWFKFEDILSVGSIDDKVVLIQIMARCRTGGKLLYEPVVVLFIDAYLRHLASIS